MKRKKKPPSDGYTPLALRKGASKPGPGGKLQKSYGDQRCICINGECKLRAAGCRGFMGCPGFKGI